MWPLLGSVSAPVTATVDRSQKFPNTTIACDGHFKVTCQQVSHNLVHGRLLKQFMCLKHNAKQICNNKQQMFHRIAAKWLANFYSLFRYVTITYLTVGASPLIIIVS